MEKETLNQIITKAKDAKLNCVLLIEDDYITWQLGTRYSNEKLTKVIDLMTELNFAYNKNYHVCAHSLNHTGRQEIKIGRGIKKYFLS